MRYLLTFICGLFLLFLGGKLILIGIDEISPFEWTSIIYLLIGFYIAYIGYEKIEKVTDLK